MPIHLIATAGQFLYEACRGAINGLTKGWGELKAKHSSSKGKSSSAAIVEQVKENPQWIQAQLQLQRQELADRRELARLQRELMRELQAEVIEVKLKEIQTLWDLDNWFSTLSREETKEILYKGQQQHRLLLLVSPPDISEDCPTSFRNNLKIELQSKLKTFLHQHYSLNVGAGGFADRPVEFYGDYFKQSISDINVKQLQKLLAPVPTVVLYSNISDYEVNFHIGYWGFQDEEVSLVPMQAWDWEQAQEELEAAGFDEKKSLRIIRQLIVAIHKLLAAFIADWYYLNIDATASYKPQLFNLQSEFAEEWFPPKVLQLYLDLLQKRQQQKLYAYTIESLQQPPWRCTRSFLGFSDEYYVSDFRTLLTKSKTKNKRWNLYTVSLLCTLLKDNLSYVFSVVFSKDGQLLASGCNDRTIKIWNPHTGRLLRTLEGHSWGVYSVAFSKDGQLLASGSDDKTIKIWNPHTGRLLCTLEGHSDSVNSVAFSDDGQLLASGGSPGLRSDDDNTLNIWNPHTGTLLRTLEEHSAIVMSVAFSKDGQLLASGSYDKTIKIWNPHTGTLLLTLEEHSEKVYSVAFSDDGQLLASGSGDPWHHSDDNNTVKICNPHTGRLLHTLSGHSSDVNSVAFSKDGQLLASGSRDKTIKIWNPHTGRLLHTLEGHSDAVTSVAFSDDGQLLASGGRDGIINIWNLYPAEKSLISSKEFPVSSPDGQILVEKVYDQSAKTWNLQILYAGTGELLQVLPGHSQSIEQVLFSEDGKTLVSLGGDLLVKVWQRG